MKDLFKLIIPIFLMPKNYDEMLKKLASFFFWETVLGAWVLRQVPLIGAFALHAERFLLSNLPPGWNSYIEWVDPLNIAVALAIAFIAYTVQLHDRLSDWLRIRARFDLANILLPLTALTGVHLTAPKLNVLATQRVSLMSQLFYRYASSTLETPLVDKHDIQQALSAWSWFWISLEGATIWLSLYIISCLYQDWTIASAFAGILLISVFLGLLIYPRLERRARSQVERIADIGKILNALLG
jgi:hypothetical protein